MAENLNYKTSSGSWCYDNNSNCYTYGRLYDLNTAMKICPVGWRLPTNRDWDILVTTAGGSEMAGKKLKSTIGWIKNGNDTGGNGTDEYGFLALPGGFYSHRAGGYGSVGRWGYWWTATKDELGWGVYRAMSFIFDDVYEGRDYSGGLSVRCVKE